MLDLSFYKVCFLDLDQLPKYLKELKPFLVKINDICVEMNISKSALALNYAIKNSFIDNVVIGVDNERQLHENIRDLNSDISLNVISLIDNLNVINTNLLYPFNWEPNN